MKSLACPAFISLAAAEFVAAASCCSKVSDYRATLTSIKGSGLTLQGHGEEVRQVEAAVWAIASPTIRWTRLASIRRGSCCIRKLAIEKDLLSEDRRTAGRAEDLQSIKVRIAPGGRRRRSESHTTIDDTATADARRPDRVLETNECRVVDGRWC